MNYIYYDYLIIFIAFFKKFLDKLIKIKKSAKIKKRGFWYEDFQNNF